MEIQRLVTKKDLNHNTHQKQSKMKIDKFLLKEYTNNFWMVADVFKNGKFVTNINKFYEVTDDWIIIYETEGGSGYGWRKGEVERKIYIGGAEFERIKISDNND